MATGVKEADVWAAADALLHAGEQPTIERVRLHLGRGSPNTVGPHLKSWFRGLSERLVVGQGSDSGIPEAVTRAVGLVWEAALTAARDEWKAAVDLERIELVKGQAALDADRAELVQVQERLQARETDLQASTQAAYVQAAAAEARLQTAEQQVKESAQAVQHIRAQLAAAQEQIDTLQQTLQTIQTAHQAVLTTAETRHATHERRWLGEIDELRQIVKKVGEELERERKTSSAAAIQHQQAINEARADIDTQIQRAVRAETAVQALTAKLEASSQSASTVRIYWEGMTTQLTSQINALRKDLAAKDRQIELFMQIAASDAPAMKTKSLVDRPMK